MSIILVRHGATALNLARVLQPADTPLNAAGLSQAHAVARELAGLGPAGVISSDLPRAIRTAEVIAVACGSTVETSHLLQERNFGELRGRAFESLGFDPLTMTLAPPGGESSEAFEHRVALAFAMLVDRRAELSGPLVVVTHGLVMRAMLARHAGVAADRLAATLFGNTAVTLLGASPPHNVAMLNSLRHLGPQLQQDVGGLVGG